jgi:GNAT superfamily N-acetyltransferase
MPIPLEGLFKIDRSHAEPAVKMLTRAFWNYPVVTHYYPDISKRQKLSDAMLACAVYSCVRYGVVYATSAKIEGAAVWTDSDDFPLGLWRMLRSIPLKYLLPVTGSAGNAMQEFDNYVNGLHKRLVPYSHCYLELLGVDPQYQGQGFSSKLMRSLLAQLDKASRDCYLETQDEKDVPIYLHFGFSIIDESIVPNTPLKNWALLRKHPDQP